MRIKIVLVGLALLLLQGISNGAPNSRIAPSRFEVDGYPVAVTAAAGRLLFQRLDAAGLEAGAPWRWPEEGGSGTVYENPRLIDNRGTTWLTFTERRPEGGSLSRALSLTEVFAGGFARGARDAGWDAAQPAVALAIESPAQDAAIGDGAPVVRVLYTTPTGIPIAPETLAFTRGGEPLDLRCAPIPGGAECSPEAPFADGPQTIEARVADLAGHLSPPASRSFTVDTAEPWLSLTSPADGFLVGQTSVRVAGYVSENVTLTIGDIPVELSPELTFAAEIPLAEGANVLILTATDAAGNSAVEVRTGTTDTQPPPPVAAALVETPRQGSRFRLEGAPGAAESHARVRWSNSRTLQQVETLAAADGSFSTAITGAEGDLLTAVVVDALDHLSPTADFEPPPPDPLLAAIGAAGFLPFPVASCDAPIEFQALAPAGAPEAPAEAVVLAAFDPYAGPIWQAPLEHLPP